MLSSLVRKKEGKVATLGWWGDTCRVENWADLGSVRFSVIQEAGQLSLALHLRSGQNIHLPVSLLKLMSPLAWTLAICLKRQPTVDSQAPMPASLALL